MTDQQTLFPTDEVSNATATAATTAPVTTSRRTPSPSDTTHPPANDGCPKGAPSSGPDRRRSAAIGGRRLRKYDRKGKRSLQYRILRWLANHGQITSTELNVAGSKDWHVQRSAGQRLRDCRSVFGLDLKRTTKDGVTTWSLDIGDRIRAKELCDIAARQARRRR